MVVEAKGEALAETDIAYILNFPHIPLQRLPSCSEGKHGESDRTGEKDNEKEVSECDGAERAGCHQTQSDVL